MLQMNVHCISGFKFAITFAVSILNLLQHNCLIQPVLWPLLLLYGAWSCCGCLFGLRLQSAMLFNQVGKLEVNQKPAFWMVLIWWPKWTAMIWNSRGSTGEQFPSTSGADFLGPSEVPWHMIITSIHSFAQWSWTGQFGCVVHFVKDLWQPGPNIGAANLHS